MLEQLLAEYQISNQKPNLKQLGSNLTFDSTKGTWKLSANADANQSVLIVKDQIYVLQDFLDYLNTNQRLVNSKWAKTQLIKKYIKKI